MGKRKGICLLSLCLLMLFAGGCGTIKNGNESNDGIREQEEPIVIRFAWWGEQARNDKTREAVALFMEKNPDIQVQTVSLPFETYYENMDIFVETGYMPDVWQGYVGANNNLLHAGLIEPLEVYVDRGLISIEDISKSLLETGMIDGKLYGISLGCNVKCMMVIPECFRKANLEIPEKGYKSWEALEADLIKIKENGIAPVAGHVFDRDFTFEYFCLQRGETKFTGSGKAEIGFSKNTYVDYYRMWLRWEEEGLVPPYIATYMLRKQPDAEETQPEYVVSFLYSNQFEQRSEKSKYRMELLPLPGMEDVGGMEIRPGMHICMSSISEHKEAAARLIDFLINDMEANQILNAERGMPASVKVRNALLPGFNEAQQEMARLIEFAEQHSISVGQITGDDNRALDAGVQGGLMEELEQQIMLRQIEPQDAYIILSERFGGKG
ncbi:ABC transporter substrate-binding protein [Eisenbergiella porci]|uniref:ABC transporter substrate-binding protein n=1 Tax=Eisenbergiella porci TaxID=2652274 RepID=UPI002A825EB8|nr:ABC transporter substrate-binding protein [Eisenbergiella porci]